MREGVHGVRDCVAPRERSVFQSGLLDANHFDVVTNVLTDLARQHNINNRADVWVDRWTHCGCRSAAEGPSVRVVDIPFVRA